MQRIDEEDVLLLSIARERVRNERSAAAIGRNGEYAREIESLY
jgi:ATP-dependent protease HslVU (ClpYQ) peptidase subunit